MGKWQLHKLILRVLFKKVLWIFCGVFSGIVVSALVGCLIPAIQNNFILLWMIGFFVKSICISVHFLKNREDTFSQEELRELETSILVLELEVGGECIMIMVLFYSFVNEICRLFL